MGFEFQGTTTVIDYVYHGTTTVIEYAYHGTTAVIEYVYHGTTTIIEYVHYEIVLIFLTTITTLRLLQSNHYGFSSGWD